MEDVPKDRYCSPYVSLETASAIYVEVEPLCDMRHQFMFWKNNRLPEGLVIFAARIRDLRPGDRIVFQGFERRVLLVQIYR